MKNVTLQLFNEGKWWDAANISFAGEQMASGVTLAYLPQYIKEDKLKYDRLLGL